MATSELAKLTRRAADRACARAQAALGVWHQQGLEGLEQDHVKAAALFRPAAALGFTAAQSLLAGCYFSGRGVERNYALAAEWGRGFKPSARPLFRSSCAVCVALTIKPDLTD
jgi:hypothetical protein